MHATRWCYTCCCMLLSVRMRVGALAVLQKGEKSDLWLAAGARVYNMSVHASTSGAVEGLIHGWGTLVDHLVNHPGWWIVCGTLSVSARAGVRTRAGAYAPLYLSVNRWIYYFIFYYCLFWLPLWTGSIQNRQNIHHSIHNSKSFKFMTIESKTSSTTQDSSKYNCN